MTNPSKSKKIFLLYVLLALGFVIYLSVMLATVLKSRDLPSLYTYDSSKAQRGTIISADGFHIATSKKLYKAEVNTLYIDPLKRDLFIELFSIYSGIDKKKIANKIKRAKGRVILSYDIEEKAAQYLKQLAYELRRYKVFQERIHPKTGKRTLHGLSVIESGESREYPYGKLLTPIIGYTQKLEVDGYTLTKGIKGLEKKFDAELQARQNASSKGPRDVNGYIILNKNSLTKQAINGLDLKISIPISLQIKIEKMLDTMKENIRAKEVMVAVMDGTNGKILASASSNRFYPKSIQRSDYPSLNSGVIEYSFEPGSVIKTIAFALLLDKGLINPYDLVNGHNGRFRIQRKVIVDEHKFDWLSAEDVIVHSSNVGIAQLAQKLSGVEFHEGLKRFGFTKKSTRDLIYEKQGSIPNTRQLDNELYKATASYGYGIHVNLMQILRSYSVFNNNGKMIDPTIVESFLDEYGREIKIPAQEQVRIIKATTAERIKQILIKTVDKGTGTKAQVAGLEIGGKTGTAHMVEKGRYVNKYNTVFAGFANDTKQKYNIVVVVVEPKKSQFASQTAVPTFKQTVDILVEEGYLKPNIIE